ncbi:MAG: hypothetical protein NZ455_15655 [Bacteroidia bacterium]|nr:hypothetical protein [Bacteroidia bacterium]
MSKIIIFWACPCGRFAMLMPTRSACYGLRYRFGALLRSALLTHPSHASRKQPLNVLPYFYAYVCFILFNAYYQALTRLKFLPCLNYAHFILSCIDFQAHTRLNLEYMDFLQPFNPEYANFTLF